MTTCLNNREVAAILAALRLFQKERMRGSDPMWEIASGCGAFTPLSNIEIDALCETINFGTVSVAP